MTAESLRLLWQSESRAGVLYQLRLVGHTVRSCDCPSRVDCKHMSAAQAMVDTLSRIDRCECESCDGLKVHEVVYVGGKGWQGVWVCQPSYVSPFLRDRYECGALKPGAVLALRLAAESGRAA